jgi:rod shape-determining protein MreB
MWRRERGDLAIDLGTANTLVYVQGRGVVLAEPSVIAVDTYSGEVHAVGHDAQRMIGRTPATISAVRPLRHGVIADFEVTEQMLRYFLRGSGLRRWARPRVVMCAPSGITEVEKRAVEEACIAAGAHEVALIEESMAAAIGSALPVAEPRGRMVVDIGGGTTEVAVISLGGIVVSESLRVGGYELDDAIATHLRHEYQLAVGQPTAEQLKLQLGCAAAPAEELVAEVRGRHIVSGLPVSVLLTSDEVRAVLADVVQQIVDAVVRTLELTPAELAGDLAELGILLAGGGALLRGIDVRLREETGMPALVSASPLTCVVEGAGLALEEFDALARAHDFTRANGIGRRRSRRPRAGDTFGSRTARV